MPEVMFTGPSGRLEGRYHHSGKSDSPLALVLHPHPQYGGTMNNKVVYTLFQSFVRLGFSVLRFNFRSVGLSQGEFQGGAGELSDAAAAMDWLQSHNPDARSSWISGYSFGAWIGMQLMMRRPEINGFVSIAPPANSKDFSFLSPCPASGMLIQGGKDEIINEPSVSSLAKKLDSRRTKVEYLMLPEADHMFTNHLKDIHIGVSTYVKRRMMERPNARRIKRRAISAPVEE